MPESYHSGNHPWLVMSLSTADQMQGRTGERRVQSNVPVGEDESIAPANNGDCSQLEQIRGVRTRN
jgi:hypothetical protein